MNAIHYEIIPQNPHAHLFEIRCYVEQPDPNGQQFYLPTWIEGSYLIREFARHIVEIRAESAGQPLKLKKLNKNNWLTSPSSQPIVVIYTLYAKELSVRTAYLDAQRAFFNGANVFLAVKNQEFQPCSLNIFSSIWEVS
jgi:predicted metalloprotease with PDZ domain